MSLGVTCGKFYPYHLGHDHLIREAKARCDELVVMVAHHPLQELKGSTRAHWIRDMHPDTRVIEVLDDIPDESEAWAHKTLQVLGRTPDVVFTSETYGDTWAAAMNTRHVPIDVPRKVFPISGTRLREDLAGNWSMLTPPAKAHYAKRVAIVGAESTGTTTLTQALARHYRTVWVPEYGRPYSEGRLHEPHHDHWQTWEFRHIAHAQASLEEALARNSNRLVIADTDPLATSIWHKRYLRQNDPHLDAFAASRHYDLYLVTMPDFPFVQDGTRQDGPHRQAMTRDFITTLNQLGTPYAVLEGTHEERLGLARAAIDSVLVFAPLGPAEPHRGLGRFLEEVRGFVGLGEEDMQGVADRCGVDLDDAATIAAMVADGWEYAGTEPPERRYWRHDPEVRA